MATRKRRGTDFRAEIDAHLAQEAEELRAQGLSPEEARAAAQRAFGNRTIVEERFYESGRWVWWDHLIRDLRFAARLLLKDPRFSVLAVLGLALGIGISTAVFELIHAQIRASAVPGGNAADLVSFNRLESGRWQNNFSYSDYRYYRDRGTSFRAVSAQSGRFQCVLGPTALAKAGTEAEEVEARFVSANFLSATGLRPALGRSFAPEEEQGGGPPAVMLNAGYWRSRFGADAGIVGKTVRLNARVVTIVGVADARFGVGDPSGFYLPVGLQPILFPRGDWLRDPAEQWLMLDAVLQPGVTASRAQAEVEVLANARERTKSADPAEGKLMVTAGLGNPGKRKQLLALAATVTVAVAMILLIACSNLANLLLARAVVRRREIGVRLSLGASRARLVCQLLTESMLLALCGGALGIVFSHWLAKTLFVAVMGAPAGFDLRLDPRVLLYCLALSMATGLSFGLAPALSATRMNLAPALHADGLSATRSRSQRLFSARNWLVIVPLAVSLMLLLGAGMAVRGAQHVYLNGPDFETSRLIAVSSPLHLEGYDEARTREFQDTLRDRVRTMPGVQSVALAGNMPLSNGMGNFPLAAGGSTDYNVISAEFFATVGVAVVKGRGFTAADREGSQPVALVNQDLARQVWPDQEAIGKQIRLRAGTTPFEVVGVAPDMEDPNGVFNLVRPTVYVPEGQGKLFLAGTRTGTPPYQMQLLVRTAGNAAAVKPAIRREALALDATLRVNVQTAAEMQESKLGPFRMMSLLLSALGLLALAMASIGIYAILAYAVSQRTREIGIRMALGAQRREVLNLVMQRTVALILCGIGFGMAGALALKTVMATTIEQLGGMDAPTCLTVALLLGAVAVLASYIPARKALRVDPVQALRWE
ncbi:MAG: ABC transporter permease [Candidatus Sulfopaludibacter sp.]|nr:ABC transporter permease [Candidatus Sulfopaludibacter sp.]